jgi:hypothetical protein
MWRESDYQGSTNWDTWNVGLMIDNERETQEAARAIVEKGIAQGLDDNQIAAKLAEWGLRKIVGPHNKNAIADAKSWNEIPPEERIDHSYEEFKDKHGDDPKAMDLFHGLVGGPDVSDSEPTLIDPEIVNWLEIVQDIKGTMEENERFERDEQQARDMGLGWANRGGNESDKMRDAVYRYHGALPEEELAIPPGKQRPDWNDPQAYYNRNVTLTPEEFMATNPRWDNYITPDTRVKLWSLANDLYPDRQITQYERDHLFDQHWDDPRVQEIVQADPNYQEIMKNGYTQRLHDYYSDLDWAITHGRDHPHKQLVFDALAQRGYTPEEIAEITKQRWQWKPNPQYLQPDAPYEFRTNPGDWIDTQRDLDKAEPIDPTLDQPGDFKLPDHWGSMRTADEWDDYFNQSDTGTEYYEHRRPFVVEFADSVEDPNPRVWIGEPNTFHADRPTDFGYPQPQHRYSGEIWENTNPPTFKGAPPDPVYDEQALRHAQRAYYNQQNVQKRAMAERSGDPQLDALIERFMQTEWPHKYDLPNWEGLIDKGELPETGTPFPVEKFRHPGVSQGMCWDMAQHLAEWLVNKGIKAYPTSAVNEAPDYVTNPKRFPWRGEDPQATDFGLDPSYQGINPDEFAPHHWTIVEMPSGTYGIDFTAAQFGDPEFPLIQRFDNSSQWQRKWASDGADFWTQSQDDWWGTQNDSLFNVNTPGEAPGMPHNMDTGADPSLFKNPCWCDVGPTDPHEWTGACENGKRPTMEHEAADHWRDEPRDETGKWTRHPDSLKPVKGKHHRLKVHDHKNHEHHIVRCWECGLPMDVYKGEVNRCHHCGARRPFEDDLLDSLKDSRTAAFNHDRFLRENGFEQFGTHEHAKAYRWTDPQGIEHRLGVSRNPNNQRYVPQDVADCQAGKCRCADALWQPAQAETVVEPDAPIHSNSLVGWGGETWTVGEIANDIAEIFNTQTGESEIVPVRDLALAKTADMVPSGQVHVMPEEGRDEWGEGQWDTDTFLDHRMLNKSLREQQQAQEYLDFMKRHKRAEDAEWPSIGMKEAADSPSYSDDPEAWMADREAWYAQEPRDCPRCGRGPTVYGSDLHGEKQEWCPSCGWTDRDEVKQQAVPKPGDYAKSRDGHPVQIIRLYTEGENLFALIRYLDGYQPYSVGGRAGGTEEDPLWEHRVYDGKVVRPGGDYYNDRDWRIERGLQLQPQDALPGITGKTAADNVPGMPVSDSGHWVWLDGKVGFGGAHHEIAEKLADELGYGKDDKAYVANWLARGHCPQDRAVAVGTFKNNRPYIWNSTRDRNHIWDAVMQAREGLQTAS